MSYDLMAWVIRGDTWRVNKTAIEIAVQELR